MRRVPAILFALFMASALLAAPALANAQSGSIITLLSSSSYSSAATGSFYVVGEVRNDTSDPARYVQVKATFYDAAGAAVASSFAFTDIDVMASGEKSPLRIILFADEGADLVSSFKLAIEWHKATAKPAALKLSIDRGYYSSAVSYHLVGEVANDGESAASWAKVAVAFYDSAGKVVDEGFTFADPSSIPPGGSAFFDILVVDANPNIASFSASAESREHSMVPGSAPAPKPLAAGPAITLNLDKESYRFGETIRIAGKVSGLMPSERFAVIEILYPGGVLYDRKTVLAGKVGNEDEKSYELAYRFVSTPDMEGKTFTVRATYVSSSATSSFVYAGQQAEAAKKQGAEKQRDADLKLSASLSEKTKIMTLSLKNPKGSKVKAYELHLSLPAGMIKSASAPKGWYADVDGHAVKFTTDAAPLKAGKSAKFRIAVSEAIVSVDWDAFDAGGANIGSKTTGVNIRK
ncbi:MAG: FxLYD domain-containing protein [Nitrososphaera sp.]|uniref:FxLYD domain-containing protein n=1 Tax=Nitrososphaera sp. TaxID=1971748 RepID=UPI003D6E3CA1